MESNVGIISVAQTGIPVPSEFSVVSCSSSHPLYRTKRGTKTILPNQSRVMARISASSCWRSVSRSASVVSRGTRMTRPVVMSHRANGSGI